MVLKLWGCVLVIGATTLMGVKKADDIREGYRQMKYLQRIMYMMESEIRYARSHLGEIFSHIARQAQEPYKSWLSSMQREMSCSEKGTFSDIWEQGTKNALWRRGLPDREVERLLNLGGQLGTVDLQLQMKVLELYQQQLSFSMQEMREKMKVSVRLYHCLGIMSGMLIAVLLL